MMLCLVLPHRAKRLTRNKDGQDIIVFSVRSHEQNGLRLFLPNEQYTKGSNKVFGQAFLDMIAASRT